MLYIAHFATPNNNHLFYRLGGGPETKHFIGASGLRCDVTFISIAV